MYAFLIAIHVIVSIFLIAVILLQAGRGGGLADSFGGSQLQSLFGTKSSTILTRLTAVCATLFILTCLSLAIISSQRSRSLVEKVNVPEAVEPVEVELSEVEEKIPAAPGEDVAVVPEETQGGVDEAE